MPYRVTSQFPGWRSHIQYTTCIQKNRLGLNSMDQLWLSDSAQRDDAFYREQWSVYYTDRRRFLIRLLWLAGGFAFVFLLCWAAAEKHQRLAYVLAVLYAILLLALFTQWAIFIWKTLGWICPRCGELFFISTLVRNPFGRSCRHCGLVRPKESEIDRFHCENEKLRL